LGYVDGQSLTAPLRYSFPNFLDPDGLQVSLKDDPGFALWSEPPRESQDFLVRENLATKQLEHYRRNRIAILYFVIDWEAQGTSYEYAIVGGDGYLEPITRSPWGSGEWRINLGDPPHKSESQWARSENSMWQRMRLYQVERIIDRIFDACDGKARKSKNLDKRYQEFHYEASLDLLRYFPKFTRGKTPAETVPVLSALLSAVIENSPLPKEQAKEGVEAWFETTFGLDLKVYRRGSHPYRGGTDQPYPWNL